MSFPSTHIRKGISLGFLFSILLSLFGCFNEDQNFIGPYFFNPSRLPSLPQEVLACVDSSALEHSHLSLIEAAQLYDSASKFVEVLVAAGQEDEILFASLSEKITIDFTFFLPTNKAWNAFVARNPGRDFTSEELISLTRGHIMDEMFTYEAIVTGKPSAPDMNGRLVVFKQEGTDCLSINNLANPVVVDGICNNGVIHLINEVFLPDGF